MAFALGGMLVRMVLLFVLVLVTAMAVPLHATGFTVSLVAMIVISLVLEVVAVTRWLRSAGEM
jgi:hypothetical protein